MTTRRIVSHERTILDKDDPLAAAAPGGAANAAASVPTNVVVKLLAFTVAMFTVPIGTYFATLNTLFKGSATMAGGAAAVMANVVLIAYIIAAVREDQSEQLAAKEKAKKGQ